MSRHNEAAVAARDTRGRLRRLVPLWSGRTLALALQLALLAGACSDHADDAAQDAAVRGQQSDPVQSNAGAGASAAGASGAAAAAAGSSGAPAPSPRDAAVDANATDGTDHAADSGSDPAAACCVATNTPGCADHTVEKCVCDADPTCCAQAWDEFCIQVAAALKCAPCTPP